MTSTQRSLFDDSNAAGCTCTPPRSFRNPIGHVMTCPMALRLIEQHGRRRDAQASATARDEAIERADKAANARWKVAATEAVSRCARALCELTTDDVWERMPADVATTREPRALGAIMRAAAKDELIEATDRVRQSDQVSCHRRPKRVWRSLVCPTTEQ